MGDIMSERDATPSRSARSALARQNSIHDQGTKWPAGVICTFTVLHPRRENVMLVKENDWRRIKRMVEESVPYTCRYQVAGSISVGAFVSFVCFWFSLKLSAFPVPCWAWVFDACTICCSALISTMCFLFDSRLKNHTVHGMRSVLNELDILRNELESSDLPPERVNQKE